MANPYNPDRDVQAEYGDVGQDMNSNNTNRKSGLITGAAIAGGVTGLILVGPIVGIAAAAGAAGLAVANRGTAGDVARASGDVVVSAGNKAKKLDEKHRFVAKTKVAAREFDDQHDVVRKTQNAAKFTAAKTAEGFRFISNKLNGNNKN